MTVWVIRLGACVNNFAHETADINTEEKHLLHINVFELKCIDNLKTEAL